MLLSLHKDSSSVLAICRYFLRERTISLKISLVIRSHMASFIPFLSHLPTVKWKKKKKKKAILFGNPPFSATYICLWSLLLLFVGDALFSSLLWVSLGLTAATMCISQCAGKIKDPIFLKLNQFFSKETTYRDSKTTMRSCKVEPAICRVTAVIPLLGTRAESHWHRHTLP